MTNRVLDIEGCINFRDLGGYLTADGDRVRWGILFRSGQLNRMTQRGIQAFCNLGIRTIVDLRSTKEVDTFPTEQQLLPEVEVVQWYNHRDDVGQGRSQHEKVDWLRSLESNDAKLVREVMRQLLPEKTLLTSSHLSANVVTLG